MELFFLLLLVAVVFAILHTARSARGTSAGGAHRFSPEDSKQVALIQTDKLFTKAIYKGVDEEAKYEWLSRMRYYHEQILQSPDPFAKLRMCLAQTIDEIVLVQPLLIPPIGPDPTSLRGKLGIRGLGSLEYIRQATESSVFSGGGERNGWAPEFGDKRIFDVVHRMYAHSYFELDYFSMLRPCFEDQWMPDYVQAAVLVGSAKYERSYRLELGLSHRNMILDPLEEALVSDYDGLLTCIKEAQTDPFLQWAGTKVATKRGPISVEAAGKSIEVIFG